MKFIVFTFMMAFTLETFAASPNYQVSFELAELGIKAFIEKNDAKHIEQYIQHKDMQRAFRRYTDSRRPPENRVSEELFRNFLKNISNGQFASIKPERMKGVAIQWRWGLKNKSAIEQDIKYLKSQMRTWLTELTQVIPWESNAVKDPGTPIHIVFLFDPGGSYPWVMQEKSAKYIYIDVLQLRGLNDDERNQGFDETMFKGFMIHEMFHIFQDDKNSSLVPSKWVMKAAVGEGSAMLFGNNAQDSKGRKLFTSKQTYLSGSAKLEWDTYVKKNAGRIKDFMKLVKGWESSTPKKSEVFKILTEQNWVSSPKNKLLFGDVYRVGAEMLLDIKYSLGDSAFYEVLTDSSQLMKKYQQIKKVN